MKKIIFFIFIVMLFPLYVNAEENKIYSINMNIYLERNGTAYVTEIWEVQGYKGKDWCKIFSNLEDVELDDISVLMDEDLYEHDEEETDAKNAKYELKYVTDGKQLCFGYNDDKKHTFMLEYEIKDYILDGSDGQILYHVLTPSITADSFYADIVTYYQLPEDLELSTPGFSGEVKIDNGRIVVSKMSGIKDEYVTLLAKFPLETFESTRKNDALNSYDAALEHSKNEEYKYPDKIMGVKRFTFIDFIFVLLSIFVFILIIEYVLRMTTGKGILKQDITKKFLNKIKVLFKKIVRLIKNKKKRL